MVFTVIFLVEPLYILYVGCVGEGWVLQTLPTVWLIFRPKAVTDAITSLWALDENLVLKQLI